MHTVGRNASKQIHPMFAVPTEAIENAPARAGTSRIANSNAAPRTNAPIVYMLDVSPSLKIDCLPLELNPCHKRARHNVAKAIVEAAIGLILSPMKNAAIVAIEIRIPWYEIKNIVDFVSTDSERARGFCLIRSGFDGSILIARAGKLSVIRLMNSSCTAVNGVGSPIREAIRTTTIAAAFPERRKIIAFLMFS